MFCEAYNQSLKEVAAGGEALSPALRQHLASCVSCREAFAEEQSLFVAIDAGLEVAANSAVPATLVPRVRVALHSEPAPQGRGFNILFWSLAGTPVLAAVVLALLYVPRQRTTVPVDSAPVESVKGAAAGATQDPSRPMELNPPRTDGVSIVQHKNAAVLAAMEDARPESPEVLVPPEERIALARCEEFLRSRQSAALLAQAKSLDRPREIEPLRIPEIEFVDLKIPALSERDSEDDTK